MEDNSYMRPVLDENGYYVDIDISDSSDCLVECQSCGLSTKLMGSPEEAIALWNQRQIPTISHCGRAYDIHDNTKYCQHCGAIMEEEVKE